LEVVRCFNVGCKVAFGGLSGSGKFCFCCSDIPIDYVSWYLWFSLFCLTALFEEVKGAVFA